MIKCLIVDDAPVARDILLEYCKLLPVLQVMGTCGDAFQAREKLQQLQVDLLFLDINMPMLSGIDLVKTLRNPPQVIFTTAYKEYATDAFDLAVCDYLVKPFSIDRFIVAVDKAMEKMGSPAKPAVDQNHYVLVRTEGVVHKVNNDRILFLESSRNNTKVFTEEGTLLSTVPLSSLERQLPPAVFSRVHRSFIINLSKVSSFQGNRVFIGKNEIPLGGNYKNDFLKIWGL
ncbi:two component transcriptional regulator, LytTR family [Mucilaginibacter lappiensis]|uniref:DNA-binding LytR/AlgR family response regulator n=1 Tax=Mucilaginibacter lappiensis TaxID=354630 RepID=A0ABR6PG23_9SPHI|nr:LytTR family DNA-binding domain-containing protein [Mucilaginibacter lappiensis]MBB6108713.1 DNA-binding LytR/AlgR family response regulator [Mucilaginibacter lappiensis]SIQ26842.1 two component transcriptional regulator, LytTR family [Mucilaginibacter lappiensis]